MTKPVKQRINQIEDQLDMMARRMYQIDASLASGSLEGSVVDSLNFMVQYMKEMQKKITIMKNNFIQDMNRSDREIYYRDKYIESLTKTEDFEKFKKDTIDKDLAKQKEIMEQQREQERKDQLEKLKNEPEKENNENQK